MLIDAKRSLLVLVDLQEKLTPLVENHKELIKNCGFMIEISKILHIPGLVSEQYAKGLGSTVKALQDVAHDWPVLDKTAFSCGSDAKMAEFINGSNRDMIILMGIEAHVCVLQTALELKQQGKHVYVIADAISSRHSNDKKYAIKRMIQHDIHVVTREMVVFEWLRCKTHEQFKKISKEFLQA